jgi:hypothetical protein
MQIYRYAEIYLYIYLCLCLYIRIRQRELTKVWIQFPLAGSLMRPASHPTHYADLVREMDEAPKRGWWERTTNKWKGFLRFS